MDRNPTPPTRPDGSGDGGQNIDSPEFPDKGDSKDEEKRYRFNLGLYRIDLLAELLEVCAKKYRKAIMKKDSDAVNDYKAMVNTLYTETFIYMEEETNFEIKGVKQDREEILQQKLDNFDRYGGEEEIMNELQDIRKIYLEIRKLLKNIGMDIPEEETVGTTETFVNG